MAHCFEMCFCGVEVDAIRSVCFWSKFSNNAVRKIFVMLRRSQCVFTQCTNHDIAVSSVVGKDG